MKYIYIYLISFNSTAFAGTAPKIRWSSGSCCLTERGWRCAQPSAPEASTALVGVREGREGAPKTGSCCPPESFARQHPGIAKPAWLCLSQCKAQSSASLGSQTKLVVLWMTIRRSETRTTGMQIAIAVPHHAWGLTKYCFLKWFEITDYSRPYNSIVNIVQKDFLWKLGYLSILFRK